MASITFGKSHYLIRLCNTIFLAALLGSSFCAAEGIFDKDGREEKRNGVGANFVSRTNQREKKTTLIRRRGPRLTVLDLTETNDVGNISILGGLLVRMLETN